MFKTQSSPNNIKTRIITVMGGEGRLGRGWGGRLGGGVGGLVRGPFTWV